MSPENNTLFITVVGMRFVGAKSEHVASANELYLVPNPANKYDKNAIEVHAKWALDGGAAKMQMAGHVSAEDCARVRAMAESQALTFPLLVQVRDAYKAAESVQVGVSFPTSLASIN
jgi:hypothetical protein